MFESKRLKWICSEIRAFLPGFQITCIWLWILGRFISWGLQDDWKLQKVHFCWFKNISFLWVDFILNTIIMLSFLESIKELISCWMIQQKTYTRLSSRQKVSRQWAQVRVTIGDKPTKLVLAGDPGQANPDLASSGIK